MSNTLKRRTILGAGALGAAATVAAPHVARAATRKLTMVTSWPRSSPILPEAAERLAQSINVLSNGSLEFEVFHSGEKVEPFAVLDAVGDGRADCYHSVEQYWIDKHPAFSFFSAVPFGLVATEMSGWLKFGGGNALWQELAGQFGVRTFMAGSPGAQMGGWFPKAINTREDMAGIRFRIPGAAGRIYKKAGMDTVNLPGSKLVDALFAGEIDAVEWIGPYLDLDYGFVKLLPHYMYPGWHDPGSIRSFGINAGLFNELTSAEQNVIEVATLHESARLEAQLYKLNGESVSTMKREYGAQVHKFPDDLLAELYRLSDEVMTGFSTHDDLAKRVHDSYRSYRDSVAQYANVSSSAYLEARNTALNLNKVSLYDD